MTGIIAIVLWFATIFGAMVYNLYRKNKRLEEIVLNQSSFVNDTLSIMDDFNALVNKIDMTMWVQSDPELLQLFETIKAVQARVQQFTGRK
jgi:hypothetical protein|tara:strand:+ start:576 stop:848 length:273 start_codon:yes stop_codon:yes gene_type:complete